MAAKALPAHLRTPANDESGFSGKHHGKSQSHMAAFGAQTQTGAPAGNVDDGTCLNFQGEAPVAPAEMLLLCLTLLCPALLLYSVRLLVLIGCYILFYLYQLSALFYSFTMLTHTVSNQAFENASTSVAASQMRNALNALSDTVTDPNEKKRFEAEMDNFFALFRRFLNDKAKGNAVNWDRIAPPQPSQVVGYDELGADASVEFLNKLAVVKLNGGLGTSMGCVGPKSVIEVREGMSFLDLSVRQIEHLNRTFNVNVPFVLMNSFNTDQDTQSIIKKYEGHNVDIITFNQSRYPRIIKDSLLPAPKSFDSPLQDWYPPGHGDVFESLYNSGTLDKLIERGIEYIFLSNADNLGAVVDLRILQHMVDSKAEYIMELTDKTKADVKGGTIIDQDGKVRLLEIAQVPKEHVNEFKSIKKFKYFNTNNIWMNVQAIKRVVEENELEMEIIANEKSIPADKKGEADQAIYQLETAVGAAIRHFKNAHGVNVPRRRFLPVKTCSDLMVVKSDLYRLEHGQLVMDPNRFGGVPVIKLGSDFKKVSDFQKRIASIPRIVELDHLTITGAVNLGRNVTLKGTVIIVATEGSTIDVPPGSVLENCVVQGSLRILEH
ncbi:UTP--glucose-1-phosphate uridylyltransferase [Penicillium argentinense]|uniref:UTP--glucose-1-phosphate uridylyltransferase n=1 Tax=Penicillium argentinense TaxID=1131581 RepID=A0A9W9KLE0_9EURO|nr:UTP--glucose-1-phosphate uridylyltransferase [Penicillium argentinense]KAJ5109693.1 UTP--glucose-1-phosphate uridylyltransferase [Penicillium argentinense]